MNRITKESLSILKEYAKQRENSEQETCILSVKELTGLLHEIELAHDLMCDFRDNWDCDEDAHRYNTSCRVCSAAEFIEKH